VLSGPVCVAGPGAGGVIRGAPEEGGSFARRIRHSVSHPSRFSSESCAVVATTEASTIIHVTRTRRDSEAGNGKSAGLSHVIGCYRAVRSVLEPPHSLSSFLFLPHSINVFMAQVIVVGGGLAGLSAAHTLLERGANVLLLDKQGSVSVFLSLFPLFFLTFRRCLQLHGWKFHESYIRHQRCWHSDSARSRHYRLRKDFL
jgi:FAD binding domain